MTSTIKQLFSNKIPVKCPVCSGFGTVNWGKQVCHGCGGKGYILIDTKEAKNEN